MLPRAGRVFLGLGLTGGMLAARAAEAPALAAGFAAGLVLLVLSSVLPAGTGLLAAVGAVLAGVALSPVPVARLLPAALPALAFAATALWFGRSLLPGREPLIVRWNRHDPARAADGARYARRLTALWAAALALLSVTALVALRPGGPDPALVAAVLLGLVAALFLGEHVVRSLVFREAAWPSGTIRAVWRAERARHG